MYIKQLEFENFRRFKHLKMDLPFDEEGNPLPVVLIGVNGAGKSSVLEGIRTSLWQLLQEKKFVERYPSFHIEYSDFNESIVSKNNDNALMKRHLLFKVENNSIKTTLSDKVIGNHTFINYNSDSNTPIGFSRNYVIKHYSSLRAIMSYEGSELENLKNYYSDSFNNKVTDFSTFLNWFEDRENYENQEKIQQQDLKYRDSELELVRSSIKGILENIPNTTFKNLRVSRRKSEIKSLYNLVVKEIVIDKNGQTFSMKQLSDGEKNLILTICDIARKITLSKVKKGIVLIDEIELHLHPSWQRVIVNALHQVFPTIQFIVTTHSPLVISHVAQESVFVLDENGEVTSMAQKPFNSYGADIEDVLKMAQGLKEVLPVDLQQKFDRYFELIDNDQIKEAKALQKEIEKMTDRLHPELVKGRALIDFKEITAE